MKSMAVIAIGSRIMKDDGIGVWVAEAIKNHLNRISVDVVIAETDFEYGLDNARAYDYVIILDAMISGNEPGSITVCPLSRDEAQKRYASQHDMSLIGMMVHEGNTSGSLIGIEAMDIDFGFGPGHTLRERFDEICGDVLTEILKIREGLTHA